VKILIYGLNFSPELTGIGKYTGDMSTWLVEQGHEVRVVTAPPYYPEWRVGEGYRSFAYRREWMGGAGVTRCPLFVPRRPRSISRLLHLTSFALTSFPVLMRFVFWRPDVVICLAPTLFCAPGALIAGALSGAKKVLHVQDLEIDAMVGLGLGLGEPGAFVRTAFWVERCVLRRFDCVSSISSSMVNRLADKLGNNAKPVLFQNWVDTRYISDSAGVSNFREEWGIPESSFVILYSGNLGEKQGLEVIFDAAKAFGDDPDVLFVIVGNGAMRDRLVAKAASTQLANVRFYPLQPYERLSDLLALGDIHLVLQKKGAADLVMPSKLTTILAAGGHALITADEATELGRLCLENPGIASLTESENPGRFIDRLRSLLVQPDIRSRRPNRIARDYAERHLDRDRVLRAFAESVLDR
jgi:colanic acid biosynthesis glycosyl transferase WcaI